MAYVQNINGYDIKDAGARRLIEDHHAPYYVLIGDSYGYDATRDDVLVTGWTKLFKTEYGLTEGTDCFTKSEGGAGFSAPSVLNRNFQQIMEYIAGTMTSEQKRLVGHVVVAGGANDALSPNFQADYKTIFRAFIASMNSLFPNAHLYVVPIGMDNRNRAYRLRAPELYTKYNDACQGKNVHFAWGAWYYRYDKRTECSDHLHLNAYGQSIATAMISNALNDVPCGYSARETAVFSRDTSQFAAGTINFDIILENDILTINPPISVNTVFNFNTAGQFVMNESTWHKLGTLESTIIPDNAYIVWRAFGRARQQSGGTFFDTPAVMSLTEEGLRIKMPYADNLSNWKTIDACTMLGIDLIAVTTAAFTM